MTHAMGPLLKRFFSHYLPVQRGLSVNSVQAYRDAVNLLLCYAADRLRRSVDELSVEDVTEEVVLGFLDAVETERGCSRRTRNARLAGIRSLFAFIAREEPSLVHQSQQIRTIPLKRTEHKTIDYLEESEIVNLRLADLRLDNASQITLHGKGNKDRTCPLWPETVATLKAYLERRAPRTQSATHVFLNANGDPITRFGIRYVTRKYGFKAGSQHPAIEQKPVNPHRIRHTTAMHLLRAGNDLNMVSYWLGHADLNTTHIYVEIDMETKRQMLDKTSAPKISKTASWHRPSLLQWLRDLAREPKLCQANSHPVKDTSEKAKPKDRPLHIIGSFT